MSAVANGSLGNQFIPVKKNSGFCHNKKEKFSFQNGQVKDNDVNNIIKKTCIPPIRPV